MQIEIIGDKGTEWTDSPRPVTQAEAAQIKAATRIDGIKLHRQFTNSTLRAAHIVVSELQSQITG